MASVVLGSTQRLSPPDLKAMAQYLKALTAANVPYKVAVAPHSNGTDFNAVKAAKLYEQRCAQCHGPKGKGIRGAYPPLAENRAFTMTTSVNLVQIVLNGGFAPSTAGNPRPFGMTPFVPVLDNQEVAGLISHIRTSWGNQASAITPLEVNRIRAGQIR